MLGSDAINIFKEMLRYRDGKGGYIDRDSNPDLWSCLDMGSNYSDLEGLVNGLDFDLKRTPTRLYMIPRLNNDIFLKNNADFKRDVYDSNLRSIDIALLNYLCVFILFLFFKGTGSEPIREVMLKKDIVKEFDEHCLDCTSKSSVSDKEELFSETFIKLAELWLAKIEGDVDSRKKDEKYGMINKAILRLKNENLFFDDGSSIKVTNKSRDLMPYYLDNKRISIINEWLKGE